LVDPDSNQEQKPSFERTGTNLTLSTMSPSLDFCELAGALEAHGGSQELSAGRRRGGHGKIADLFSGKYSGTQELFVDSTEFGTPAKARMPGCAFIMLYLQGESPNPSP
jgi:hypothetical protein